VSTKACFTIGSGDNKALGIFLHLAGMPLHPVYVLNGSAYYRRIAWGRMVT
jgi:hypothetical protein